MGLIVAILIVLGFEGLQGNTIFDIIYWWGHNMSVYSTPPKNKEDFDRRLRLLADILEEHIERAMIFESVDKEALIAAKLSLQTGFMWFQRGLDNSEQF